MFTEAPVRNWCVQQSCTHRLFNVTSAGVRISTAFRELKLHYHCWELSRSSRSRVYECATMAKSPNGLAGSVFSSKFFSLQRCKAQMKHTLVETSKNIMRPFLLLHGWTCRTWTIFWTEGLTKCGDSMSTPALMEVDNDDNVVDIINCVALYYEKGASGNAFLRKEKFRAPVSRQVKTLKALKETVR